MKNRLKWLTVCVAAAAMAGCVTQYVPPGATYTSNGALRFEAEGMSISENPNDPLDMAKAKLAAGVNAKANLLEKLKGAYVEGSVQVADLVFASQEAASMVDGWLSRATVVYETDGRPKGPRLVRAIASIELKDIRELRRYVE